METRFGTRSGRGRDEVVGEALNDVVGLPERPDEFEHLRFARPVGAGDVTLVGEDLQRVPEGTWI